MADNVPTEVRCPHCEGVIPPDWVLNVCPQCGRSVPLEELRRAAVADAPTEEPPTTPEEPTMTSVAAESEPSEASEPFIPDLPFDTEPLRNGTASVPYFATDVVPPPTRPCVHHSHVESVQFCLMCGKSYCDNCLVEFRGRKICGACKDAEVAALQRQSNSQAPMTALIFSIIGVAGGAMCCVICACSIVGIVMGYQSLREIREGQLPPSSRPTAVAAVTVGWVGIAVLVLHVVYSIIYFSVLGFSVWNAR